MKYIMLVLGLNLIVSGMAFSEVFQSNEFSKTARAIASGSMETVRNAGPIGPNEKPFCLRCELNRREEERRQEDPSYSIDGGNGDRAFTR